MSKLLIFACRYDSARITTSWKEAFNLAMKGYKVQSLMHKSLDNVEITDNKLTYMLYQIDLQLKSPERDNISEDIEIYSKYMFVFSKNTYMLNIDLSRAKNEDDIHGNGINKIKATARLTKHTNFNSYGKYGFHVIEIMPGGISVIENHWAKKYIFNLFIKTATKGLLGCE